eukprot:1361174-Amphidinium_carterae.1
MQAWPRSHQMTWLTRPNFVSSSGPHEMEMALKFLFASQLVLQRCCVCRNMHVECTDDDLRLLFRLVDPQEAGRVPAAELRDRWMSVV